MKKNIWTRSCGDYLTQDIDRWSSSPLGYVGEKWLGGLVVPLVILLKAYQVIVTREGIIFGSNHSGGVQVQGVNAVLLGCVFVSGALFLHTHYFWGNSRRLLPLHEVGKTISLLGFCVFVGWLLFRLFTEAFC